MSRSRLVIIGAVVSIVAALGVAPAAQAAEDYFLQFQTGTTNPPIAGESQDPDFENAVVVNSFDWSANNGATPTSSTTGGATKISLNRLTVEKHIDSASPALFQRAAIQTVIPSMRLTVRRAGANPFIYLTYRFKSVIVTSVSPSGDGDAARERVTFVYGAVTQHYAQQTDTGSRGPVFTAGWNQVANVFEEPGGWPFLSE
jgi:type VI protein secretion system component Hcp